MRVGTHTHFKNASAGTGLSRNLDNGTTFLLAKASGSRKSREGRPQRCPLLGRYRNSETLHPLVPTRPQPFSKTGLDYRP